MDKHIPWGIHPLESKHPDELLEIPQDDEGYYLDSEGNRIAFNGNRELKPAYVRLALNQYHIDEIRKCSEDLKYFIFNYCKVLTKTGWRIPDLRDYQEEYILNMLTQNRLILNSPRQSGKCTHYSTTINIRNKHTGEIKEISIGEFHELVEAKNNGTCID